MDAEAAAGGERGIWVSRKILVTGAAGFIGYHTAERLLALGDDVNGVPYSPWRGVMPSFSLADPTRCSGFGREAIVRSG